MLYDGRFRLNAERIVIDTGGEFDFRALALRVLHVRRGLAIRLLVGIADRTDKLHVVAACLATDQNVIGDDIGGVASGLSVTAAEDADVRGPLVPVLGDLAEPTAL